MNYRILMMLIVAGVFSLPLQAQVEQDTVKIIKKADKVVVTRKGDKTVVEATTFTADSTASKTYRYTLDIKSEWETGVFSDNWGMNLPFMNTSKTKQHERDRRVESDVTMLRHIYWGWHFNYDSKSHVKNCFELGVRDVIGAVWRRGGSEFEIGLGFGMKRLLAQNGFAYSSQGDFVGLIPLAPGLELKNSRLDVWSFTVPVLYNQKVGRSCKFSIGGVMNMNTYARAVTCTSSTNTTHKTVMKGLHQNFLTADLLGVWYVDGVGLYASWCPFDLFKSQYGPAAKSWSLGVDLFF